MDKDKKTAMKEQAREIQKLLQKSTLFTDGMLFWVTVLDIIIPLIMVIALAIQGGSSILDIAMIIVGGLILFGRYSIQRASPLMYINDVSKRARSMMLTYDDVRVEKFLFLLRNVVVITTLVILVATTSLLIVAPIWPRDVIVICAAFTLLILFICALYAYRYFKMVEWLVCTPI